MCILGIETSCDETGVAIYSEKKGLLSNHLYSQAKIHSIYGGVVPELASRNHINKIIPLIKTAMFQANLNPSKIQGIAYTAGPGLIGSLMVGATISKALAYSWQIPAIAVNHMEGHLLAPMLEKNPPLFPFLALLISGGHTQLIAAKEIGKYKLLGESIDDAVGEAFDKTAKLLGLDYPGGSKLSLLAQQGVSGRYVFPRPLTKKPGLSFSFSGLKVFTANVIRNNPDNDQVRADVARAFEDAVIETLIIKCKRALDVTHFDRLVVSGGVSANKMLRTKISKMMIHRKGKAFYARPEFCTDNGAMIAYTGMIRLQKKLFQRNLSIFVRSKWPLEDLFVLN